jgi:hypothetical protein
MRFSRAVETPSGSVLRVDIVLDAGVIVVVIDGLPLRQATDFAV